jgi:hypothetical protein
MVCPKTTKCGCPGVICKIPKHCLGISNSVCHKASRKPSKSRRQTSSLKCKYGMKKSGGCKKKPGVKRKASRKPSKSRRQTSSLKCKYGMKKSGGCKKKPGVKRKASRKPSKSRRTPPNVKYPGSGWSKLSPNKSERTTMVINCGKKCFLGPDKSFPICAKGTCKVNDKGVYAAYVRAKQWGGSPEKYKGKSQPRLSKSTYQKIARRAKSRLIRSGYGV